MDESLKARLKEKLGRNPTHADMLDVGSKELFDRFLSDSSKGLGPTRNLVFELGSCFVGVRPIEAAFAICVFEELAYSEFLVLEIVLRRMHEVNQIKALFDSCLIHHYLEIHKTGELRHASGLVSAIEQDIRNEEHELLQTAFAKIVMIMEKWWIDITNIAKSNYN